MLCSVFRRPQLLMRKQLRLGFVAGHSCISWLKLMNNEISVRRVGVRPLEVIKATPADFA